MRRRKLCERDVGDLHETNGDAFGKPKATERQVRPATHVSRAHSNPYEILADYSLAGFAIDNTPL